MRSKSKDRFRKIRRIVGISSLILAFAIAIVPVNLLADPAPEAGAGTAVLEVTDNRASVKDLPQKTSATATGLSAPASLTISDSAGTEIFAKMDDLSAKAQYDQNAFYNSDTRSAFTLSLTGEADQAPISYQSMTMLLVLPEAYRKDGFISVLGLTPEGLGLVDSKEITAGTDHLSLYFSYANYPQGEFALLYHAAPVTKVQDERTDTTKADRTTASISNDLKTDRLVTLQSTGNTIKGLLEQNGSYAYDDLSVFTISLTDDKGTPLLKDGTASDYGTLMIQMALPDKMKLSEGRVKLFSVNPDGSLNTEMGEETGSPDDTDYLTFRTENTGEFAIAYFKNAGSDGIVQVTDNRKDCSSANKTTASISSGFSGGRYLQIEPSEASILLPLIQANGTYQYTDLSAFTLTMTDAAEGGNVIGDFGNCTITMALPDDMSPENGRVYLLGVNGDGTLNSNPGVTMTTAGDTTYLTFETPVMTEYAFLFDAANQYDIAVEGTHEEIPEISATVTADGSGSRKLYVEEMEDPESSSLYTLVQASEALSGYTEGVFYEMEVKDSAGNEVDDFGTCTVTMTLPENMDPAIGTFQILTVKENDEHVLDQSVNPVIRQEDGKNKLVFTTTHFTPYAVLYTAEADTSAAGSDTTSPVVVKEGNTLPEKKETGSSTTGTDQSSSGSTTTPAAGGSSSSVVTKPGNELPEKPAATSGTSGTADMPKTADMTTYRNIFVMILLLFGALMLISSFRYEKRMRRRKE